MPVAVEPRFVVRAWRGREESPPYPLSLLSAGLLLDECLPMVCWLQMDDGDDVAGSDGVSVMSDGDMEDEPEQPELQDVGTTSEEAASMLPVATLASDSRNPSDSMTQEVSNKASKLGR
jgi:hypothetical protein